MVKFFKNLILFLFPLILFSYGIDIFISKNLKKSNTYTEGEFSTWNAIFDRKINSEILVYGNSRAWMHINSKTLSQKLNVNVYNLGISGHNFWLQNLRHSLIMELNKKPKIIIHSIDIFTLDKKTNLYLCDQFLPYMLWNSKIKAATKSYNGFKNFDYIIPLIRYYGKHEAISESLSMFFNLHPNPKKRINGFEGQDKKWNSDFEVVKKNTASFEANIDNPSVKLFETYLDYCKKKGIRIIFVYTPEFIEGQKFIKNRNQIINIFKNYSKKYNILFLDYSNDPISHNKKYFYNVLHMNKNGADVFSERLGDTLKINLKLD
jgi:hypothetical protein